VRYLVRRETAIVSAVARAPASQVLWPA